MKWKIGDKVRLTGKKWPELKSPMARSSEHTITRVNSQGSVRLSGYTGCSYWILTPGYEIELVEREEETMSVDFSEVNVGDKVRLTRENGDETTFTAVGVGASQTWIGSETTTYERVDWDTLEIVERAFKPVPGLYTHPATGGRVAFTENGKAYFTSSLGAWVGSDHENPDRKPYKAVREQDGWRREITF